MAALSSPISNLYFILVALVVFIDALRNYIYIYSAARSFEARDFEAGDSFEAGNSLQPMRDPTRDPLWPTPEPTRDRGQRAH